MEKKELEKEIERLEHDYSLLLEHVTFGLLSKTNYKIEDILPIVDDKQNEWYEGTIKEDILNIVNGGGTLEDVMDYVNDLNNN